MNGEAPSAPRIDVLLEGYGVNTNVGLAAFCAVIMIEGPDAAGRNTRILVDPAHVGRRTFLQDALGARGLTVEDIDKVVLTHAHWDHVQNIDVFEHAPIYLHAEERMYSRRPHRNDWATPAWTGDMLERMTIEEIEEGDEIIPGVGIVGMPGHTVGSVGVTVNNADGISLITGDALHYASVALTRDNPLVFWDDTQARASIDKALGLANIIYPGHDQAFRLTEDGEIDYVRPFNLTITGATRDQEGLEFDPTPRPAWTMPGVEEQSVRLEETRSSTSPL